MSRGISVRDGPRCSGESSPAGKQADERIVPQGQSQGTEEDAGRRAEERYRATEAVIEIADAELATGRRHQRERGKERG